MAELIEWDAIADFGPVNVSYFIQNVTRQVGANLNGIPQIVGPTMTYWKVVVDLAQERNQQKLKIFEALVAEMEGQTNVASFTICDPYRYGARVSPNQFPFTDTTWFSDGYGFINNANGSGSGVEPVTLLNAASAGAGQIYLNYTNPARPTLRRGDLFSINGFMYRVLRTGGGGWTKIGPPLRRDVAAGVTIQTNPARFYGRFVDDAQGERMRERLRYGAPLSLTFVEAFERTFE